jgi:hypothetical protein
MDAKALPLISALSAEADRPYFEIIRRAAA